MAWVPTHSVPDGGMAVWASPDSSARPILTVAERVELVVDQRLGDLASVRAENGWTGWVDGRRLVELQPAATHCRSCGAPLPAVLQNCPNCGASTSDSAESLIVPLPLPIPLSAPAPQELPQTQTSSFEQPPTAAPANASPVLHSGGVRAPSTGGRPRVPVPVLLGTIGIVVVVAIVSVSGLGLLNTHSPQQTTPQQNFGGTTPVATSQSVSGPSISLVLITMTVTDLGSGYSSVVLSLGVTNTGDAPGSAMLAGQPSLTVAEGRTYQDEFAIENPLNRVTTDGVTVPPGMTLCGYHTQFSLPSAAHPQTFALPPVGSVDLTKPLGACPQPSTANLTNSFLAKVPSGSQDQGFVITVNGQATAYQDNFGDGFKVNVTLKNNNPLDPIGLSVELITDKGTFAGAATYPNALGDFGNPGVTASTTLSFETDTGNPQDQPYEGGNPVALFIQSTTGAWGLASLPR
jgi:hypothetical protein